MTVEAPVRVAVIYYSATGNVHALARALCSGAESSGAQVRLRRVPETASEESVKANVAWQKHQARDDLPALVSLQDLEWANGVAIGSPTRFGGPASQLKSFLDQTGRMWMRGDLMDKVGTSFTSASTHHGGLESSILAMNNVFYHWGCLILPLGYPDRETRRGNGNPYGASFVSRSGAAPDPDSLKAAHVQGRRLARAAEALVRNRTG